MRLHLAIGTYSLFLYDPTFSGKGLQFRNKGVHGFLASARLEDGEELGSICRRYEVMIANRRQRAAVS